MVKMQRQILHVDVNNAFLSWTAIEMLKNGSKIDIRNIPAIIGGDESKRSGIVLAKSTKAKEYGIKTAETIYQAKLKCPSVQIFPSNHGIYKKYSDKLYQLLQQYTDKIERFSIDECFLDMTEYLREETLLNKAKEINQKVKQELGFTVNVGVAHNKLLAKMASDFTKPDKVHTLFEEEIPTKMWTLPVSELFMLGKKTVPKLHDMSIKTIKDLAQTDPKILQKKFGKHGIQMWEYANGIDKSEVKDKPEKPKGIGHSVTFPKDITQIEELEKILLKLVEQTTYRLRKYELKKKTVSVQLRTKEFEDKTHQGKLLEPTANTKDIYQKAKELLHQMYQIPRPIRLLGVRIDNLVEKEERQLSLFQNESSKKQEKLDQVMDQLKEKYGYQSITRAKNLPKPQKIGFTIGKFAPLHKGHQYLIETALQEMDKFYVVIYETDVIPTPIETRANWIKRLYPQVEVLYAYHPPKQYGLDQKSVKIQMDYLIPIIKNLHCTHFYSSEPYGEKVAKYLNIIDRRVDPKREKLPIRATHIRENLEQNKQKIENFIFEEIKNSLN